jgi:hypothetical protein
MTDEMTLREIDFVRVFDAPRELVWRAWTDPDQIAAWWGPEGMVEPIETLAHAWEGQRGIGGGGATLTFKDLPQTVNRPTSSVSRRAVALSSPAAWWDTTTAERVLSTAPLTAVMPTAMS